MADDTGSDDIDIDEFLDAINFEKLLAPDHGWVLDTAKIRASNGSHKITFGEPLERVELIQPDLRLLFWGYDTEQMIVVTTHFREHLRSSSRFSEVDYSSVNNRRTTTIPILFFDDSSETPQLEIDLTCYFVTTPLLLLEYGIMYIFSQQQFVKMAGKSVARRLAHDPEFQLGMDIEDDPSADNLTDASSSAEESNPQEGS